MAPRANWKGYLKLSLVSCAVNLYPASSTSSRVSFNTINRKTGNKVKRQFVDAETGDVVENEDQAKGYPVAKDSYLLVDDDELDKIQIESTHTIDIEKFVPRAEIDPRYYDAPYYIAPSERVGEEAFAIIRDAMRDEKVVGLGRVVIARRERIMMLEPLGKGILGTALRYGSEVRGEDAYFEDIPDLQAARGDEGPGACHHRKEGGALPAGGIHRPLRGRGRRAHSRQAGGHAGKGDGAAHAADQCRQHHGCASQEHRGRGGEVRCRQTQSRTGARRRHRLPQAEGPVEGEGQG